MTLEMPDRRGAGWRDLRADLDGHGLGNGVASAIMATTGPLAVFLAAAAKGGLGPVEVTAFIFASYGVGGIFSIVASLFWRQTLGMCWTIPGMVLVGAALGHLSYGEIIGTYLTTGLLLALLGLSGLVGRLTAALPMPIVMGMVAGVFLSFGLSLVNGFGQSWAVTLAMVAAFAMLTRFLPAIPPVLGALLAGVAVILVDGEFQWSGTGGPILVLPTLFMPVFSWRSTVELVVPLAITVVGIHNAQGVAVLRSNGFKPPTNAFTLLCGIGSLFQGVLGAPPLCVTGPVNAVLNLSGRHERRYVGGVVFGIVILVFGLFAPLMTRLILGLPPAFIGALGGLAMLRVLEQSFVTGFSGRFTLGALTAFLVTVANVSPFNIGAPFWALVFGYLVSRLLESRHFATAT